MADSSQPSRPLITVSGLTVSLGRPSTTVVGNVGFAIHDREIIGIAGESGSGKSVTALSLARLLPPGARARYAGDVRLRGISGNLLQASEQALRRIRGNRLGYIFQEPSTSFNPVFTILDHLTEILHCAGIPPDRRRERVSRAMREVGLPSDEATLRAYPGDFSGGMLQRAAIACALLGAPELLIADEPTTALDTSTQRTIVDLLVRLNHDRGMAVLFISHDLGLLKEICTRLLVMRKGAVVESGKTAEVLARPHHPYTRNLLQDLPKLRLRPGRPA